MGAIILVILRQDGEKEVINHRPTWFSVYLYICRLLCQCVTELLIPFLSLVTLYVISYFHLQVFRALIVTARLRYRCDA